MTDLRAGILSLLALLAYEKRPEGFLLSSGTMSDEHIDVSKLVGRVEGLAGVAKLLGE